MTRASIEQHCRELNRCNQRGGRMLSILDLLDAESLDYDLAAYLMAKISRGASFMVGALPGGAGKTTVMCALLNLMPADVPLVAATPEVLRSAAAGKNMDGTACYICHEIGSGPWFAYLWGCDLQAFCLLKEQGQILATNLHADDLRQTRHQVCVENGVPEAQFHGFELLIYLRVKGGLMQRRHWIDLVYSSDNSTPHEKVYENSMRYCAESIQTGDPWQQACRDFLEEEHQGPRRTIEEVRAAVLRFYASS